MYAFAKPKSASPVCRNLITGKQKSETARNVINIGRTTAAVSGRAGSPKLSKITVGPISNTFECGGYFWQIKWKLDKPTTKGGYVVQKADLKVNVKDCKGKPYSVQNTNRGYNPKHYPFWEAWKIGKNKDSTGAHVDDTYHWFQAVGNGTRGFIEVRGIANYYDGLVLPSSFKVNSNSPSGLAPMTRTNPNLKGGSGAIQHTLKAEWNCCGKNKNSRTKITTR